MANFPIENRVKLTYNIKEVRYVAEFCVECWNKINKQNKPRWAYILSFEFELCEECGEWKRTVVAERMLYKVADKIYSLRKNNKA